MHQRLHPPIAIVWTNRPSNIQSVSFIFSFRKDLEPFDPFFLVFYLRFCILLVCFPGFPIFFKTGFLPFFWSLIQTF
jgi:hypothetical protein